MASALRKNGLSDEDVGAAHLRWPSGTPLPLASLAFPFGVVVVARHSARWEHGAYVEVGARLDAWVVSAGVEASRVDGKAKGDLLRLLTTLSPRQKPDVSGEFAQLLRALEERLSNDMRKPTPEEQENKVVHTAFPIFAGVMTPG
jgi:hypothetical protein